MNTNSTYGGGSSLGNNNKFNQNNHLTSTTTTTNTNNYRKPFKPNFGNDDNDQIEIQTTKKVISKPVLSNHRTNNLNSNTNFGVKPKLTSQTGGKITNMINKPRFDIEEVEDDRVAVATGEKQQ
jgi:hypothetical protein